MQFCQGELKAPSIYGWLFNYTDNLCCYQLWLCYLLQRRQRFNKVFILSVIFNFVFDQPADPRAAVSLCALTAVLCFFFGALCLSVCVANGHCLTAVYLRSLYLDCQVVPDKRLQCPPYFSLCFSSQMSTREQEIHTDTDIHSSSLLHAMEGLCEKCGNIFPHFPIVVNSVSLYPVSPGSRWHLCVAGNGSLLRAPREPFE